MFEVADVAGGAGGGCRSPLDDEAYYERLAAFDLLVDESELTAGRELTGVDLDAAVPPEPWAEVGFDGRLEALAAADPESPRDPAVVVADAERLPVTGGRILELLAVDPARLDESGRVGLAVAWSRVENWAAARKLLAVADVAGPQPDPDQPLADGAFAWAEIGAALRVGDGESTTLVHAARQLTGYLPGTVAAMCSGDLSWRKVRSLVAHTGQLDAEACARVEDRVLSKAAGRTPAQHDAAVRRAVDRVDPDTAAARRAQAMNDIALLRTHYGDGIGEIFARMPSEDVEIVWTGADAWARRTKETGDPRTLDQLRVAALIRWAESFLTHGHPTSCDRHCQPDDPADSGEPIPVPTDRTAALPAPDPGRDRPPRRHGRPITVNITVDLPTFLGLTNNPGELLGPGALIPAAAIRDLIPDAQLRRLITHPTTGHLLDATPHAIRPSAPLAGFCALRDVTATTPTAGPTTTASSAGAGDLDHIHPHADSGPTVRANLHSPTRRWHRAKTHAGWTVTANPDSSWTWTSPAGRTYRTQPHDYRLGP